MSLAQFKMWFTRILEVGGITFTQINVANTGLKLTDTGGDHVTTIKQNSDEAASRTLNIPALGGDDTLMTLATAQTITGAKTFGATAINRTGQVYQMQQAKVGATSGWVVNAADNKNSLARLPASQSASTLVVPIRLKVGQSITGYYLVGQIESAGGSVTIDAALRKQTAAAADLTDGAVTSAAITQLAVTADTIISAANAGVASGIADSCAADETFYLLITATTAGSTDIDLQSINIIVTET